MGRMLEIVTPLHKATKRDYLARMNDDKVHCMVKAKEYELDYWDGDRRYGYGGYKFIEGRWKPVAQALIDVYGLKNGSSVLDVGCGKAFLLYEMKKILPDLRIAGFDISKHGLADARDNIKPSLFRYRAQDRYPYGDGAFDLVISLGCFHNLKLFELQTAVAEVERVGKNKYIMVEGYRDELEQFNLECWALTAEQNSAHVGMDLALQSFRIYRRLRIHLFRIGFAHAGEDSEGCDSSAVAATACGR